MKNAKTLRDLVDEFGANGVIRIDDGQGSAGPVWIEWDEMIDTDLGGTKMYPAKVSDRAYDDDNSSAKTLEDVAKYIIRDYSTDELYASEWIDGGNGYWFRLVF
jgi:hypothetical protein